MRFGSSVEMKRLVRRDDVLDARDAGAHAGPGAGRDQDVFRAHAPAVGEQPHGVRILQHGAALDDRDVGARQVRRVGGFQPRDFLVLVGDQRRPVEGGRRHGPAVARRILEFVGKARGVDQQLLRHAAADHAGAADAIFLRQHHARAVTRGDARGAHAARAAADDEQIGIEVGHAASWRLARSRDYGPFFFISARKRFITSSETRGPIAAAQN